MSLFIEPGIIEKHTIENLYGESVKYLCLNNSNLLTYNIFGSFEIGAGFELAYFYDRYEAINYPEDILELEKRVEISGIVDLNYNLLKKTDLGIRYNHALTAASIYTATEGITSSSEYLYTRYLQFYLRYRIASIE